MQFLGILSYKAKEKKKLLSFESFAKSLKDEELWIKNQDKALANYAKQFTKTKSKASITWAEDSEDLATISLSKCKLCKKKYELNDYWQLQAKCHYCHDVGHFAKFCKKKALPQISLKEVVTYTQNIPFFVN